MDHCLNCGSALSPSAQSCPTCRLPSRSAPPQNEASSAPPLHQDEPHVSTDLAPVRKDNPFTTGRDRRDSIVDAMAEPEPTDSQNGDDRSGLSGGRAPAPRTVVVIVGLVLGLAVLLGIGAAGVIVATSRTPTPPASGPSATGPSVAPPAPTSTPLQPSTPTASPEMSPSSAGPTAWPAGAVTCEPNRVAVPREGTSCAFAVEVAGVAEAEPKSRGVFDVTTRSPVTKKTYTLTCLRDGALVTCSGSTGAIVYVWQP